MTRDERERLAGPARFDDLALRAALAVPWLFIWQGLDFTDQGYLLTTYRCFFRHPEATEDSAPTWLTNLVGAIWDAIFGSLGVVGMRALWALCMSLGMVLAVRLLRATIGGRVFGLAALPASVFLSDRRETWFSYNTSSSLVFAAAAVCLVLGIEQRKKNWLFSAGVLIGVAPFARFPNLLAAALVATIGFAALIDPERRRTLLRDLGLTCAGIVAGVCGTLALIQVLGHARLFYAGIAGLFLPSVQSAGYSFSDLFSTFVREQTLALEWGAAVCASGWLLSQALGRVPVAVGWLLACATAGLAAYGLSLGDEPWRFVVTGTSYWVLAAIALGLWKRRVELRVAAFAVLTVVVIAPLGSNNGIKNAHMGLWLALPLIVATLLSLDATLLKGQALKLALIVGLTLTGEGLSRAASYTYRDSLRSTLLTPVQRPQLRAQFTSPERAQVVAEVLDALRQRVSPGDYLLAYEGTPLLQYLTKTTPYLNRAWVMGYESGDVIAKLAAEAPRRTGCLPVVVVSSKTTRSFDWPRHSKRLEERQPQRGTRKVLKAFLRAHDYQRTWTNGFFEILETPSAHGAHCR